MLNNVQKTKIDPKVMMDMRDVSDLEMMTSFAQIMKHMEKHLQKFTVKRYGLVSEIVAIKHQKDLHEFIRGLCKTFGDTLPSNLDKYANDKEWLYLHTIEVPDKIQRKGIGSELMGRVMHYAKKNKLNIMLTVENYGNDLHRFYTKHGFERITKTLYYKKMSE